MAGGWDPTHAGTGMNLGVGTLSVCFCLRKCPLHGKRIGTLLGRSGRWQYHWNQSAMERQAAIGKKGQWLPGSNVRYTQKTKANLRPAAVNADSRKLTLAGLKGSHSKVVEAVPRTRVERGRSIVCRHRVQAPTSARPQLNTVRWH